jgi:hypothetical protein
MQKQFEKPTICPACKDPKHTLWHNTGEKNGKKWGNLKCNCGYLVWDKIKQTGDWNETAPGVFNAPQNTNNSPTSPLNAQVGNSIIADELTALGAKIDGIDKRIDNMSAYLVREIEGIKNTLNKELGE